MTKHQKIFQEMISAHEKAFTEFKDIHDKYALKPDMWQNAFNLKGAEITDIIRKYEKLLCSNSESGQYGKYSANLADKFWTVVRAYFPKINFVGIS